jgi:ubiquitin carboxyl-terminal hydrolase 36/42
MALCEIVYPVPHPIPVRFDTPLVTVRYGDALSDAYFTRVKCTSYFDIGAPIRQLGGLINIGYNCYMNSVIQCLAYTPGFANFCQSLPNVMYQRNSMGPFFLDSFAHIFRQMETNKSACPDWFIQDAGILSERYRRPLQQDSHEFFLNLLSRFNQECLTAMDVGFAPPETPISHFFTWRTSSQIHCERCSETFQKDVELIDLTIPLGNQIPDLASGIADLTSEEPTRISVQCEHCGAAGGCIKSSDTVRFPLILVATLMRFDNQLRKIDDFVEYPEVIDVHGKHRYQLYAMILHEGRVINHGHFFAYVRDQNDVWYKADDVCVYRVKPAVVMHAAPYVLFYKMIM